GAMVSYVQQHHRVLGDEAVRLGAQHRNLPEGIDGEEVRAIGGPLRLEVDGGELRFGAGLVKRDPGRERASHRGEIKLHVGLLVLNFVSYGTNIIHGQGFFCEMVQKSPTPRGRPRAYDPDAALARAVDAFWDAGFAATSLDDLSAATG